tara:strand:- start:3955 stop:4362 length:408 start_codon:yes stop_codon:yes gene_type:complete
MRVLVDTDVVSYGLRSDPLFDEFYGPALDHAEPYVSFMTIGELEHGAALRSWGERRTGEMRSYLKSRFTIIPSTTAICRQYGALMAFARAKGRALNFGDGWIAATAVVYGISLMTNNRRDFEYLPGLQLITRDGN